MVPVKTKDGKETKSIDTSKIAPELVVGLPIFFELVLRNKRLRAQAFLVGWIHEKLMITTVPYDSRLLIISKGTELIVRYLLEGRVYGFKTRLLHKQTDPTALWMLEYPDIIEIKNLRRSPRIPLFLEVFTSEGRTWNTVDISAHGACLAVDQAQKVGNVVALNFSLPNGEQVENLTAHIVRIFNTQDEYQVGVQFDEIDKEQLQTLRSYLKSIQLATKK